MDSGASANEARHSALRRDGFGVETSTTEGVGMKFTLACVAVVLAATSFGMVGARQQETKAALIEAKYFESADRTEVSTRGLPLKREPAQMLEVAFYAGYPTARLSAPPDVIILRFISFGHALLYRQPEQRAHHHDRRRELATGSAARLRSPDARTQTREVEEGRPAARPG